MSNSNPTRVRARPHSTLLSILLLWGLFYATFTLFTPPLLDDADSVHVEVAREMITHGDYVTLHANNIRYLEKAPLLYWSMAASMKVFILFGFSSPRSLAVAARIPLALTVLALALLLESFARRLFHSRRAGLYTALITLSSFGLFLFTRISIPDAGVCLWTTLALYAFYRTEELEIEHQYSDSHHALRAPIDANNPDKPSAQEVQLRLFCGLFALACALNVLTKGLIGVVFPTIIVGLYLLITRGVRRSLKRLRQLHPWATVEAFLLVAAPWHVLAGLANPTEGNPARFRFITGFSLPFSLGHWLVPLPTDGNVRGWFWFYFMNEHLLRYLNLRIPHDYDTSPLWLFWGLCFIWLAPWSAWIFKATSWIAPFFGKAQRSIAFRSQLSRHDIPLKRRGALLILLWAVVVLLFFAFSTRQEYYVLPALPALALILSGYLAHESREVPKPAATAPRPTIPTKKPGSTKYDFGNTPARGLSSEHKPGLFISAVLLLFATLFASATVYFLVHSHAPTPNTDLSQLLQQNPSDYALSLGHFLDLNAIALGLFRLPLALAAAALFFSTLGAFILRRRSNPHASNISLFAGAFVFLLAAHLGLQTFSPVLTSAQLAKAIAPHIGPFDLIVIHGEYEAASTLSFYLERPDAPGQEVHILDGRSSNLWYGSFFPDAPPIFETSESLAAKWNGPDRIFLWQSLTDEDPKLRQLPPLPGPVYILVKSGGKEILSNRPNR